MGCCCRKVKGKHNDDSDSDDSGTATSVQTEHTESEHGPPTAKPKGSALSPAKAGATTRVLTDASGVTLDTIDENHVENDIRLHDAWQIHLARNDRLSRFAHANTRMSQQIYYPSGERPYQPARKERRGTGQDIDSIGGTPQTKTPNLQGAATTRNSVADRGARPSLLVQSKQTTLLTDPGEIRRFSTQGPGRNNPDQRRESVKKNEIYQQLRK